MVGNSWNSLEMAGKGLNGFKYLEMAGNENEQLEMAGITRNGWKLLKWLEIVGHVQNG